MDKELNLLLPLIDDQREFIAGRFTFHLGAIGEQQIAIMKSGIGKVNAALATQCMIDNFAPRVIINSGVAGGVGGAAAVLDVVVADRVCYSDVWCGPGTLWGEASQCPLYFTTHELGIEPASNIKKGLICSSDKFISKSSEVEFIKRHFPDVMAVDMESGAIAQTCYLNDTPLAVIRVVSDTPGEDDNITQYEDFWQKAPEATFNIIRDLLSK